MKGDFRELKTRAESHHRGYEQVKEADTDREEVDKK